MDPRELETIDWNQVWKARVRGYLEANGGVDCVRFWNDRASAERYWSAAREPGGEQHGRVEKTIGELQLSAGDRVLDVGAGPGVVAVPLGRAGHPVTAVEPSAAMMDVLEERARDAGADRIRCIRKRWEDVVPSRDLDAPYEVVLCSMSLAMTDLRAALEKMQAVASRRVVLYWFAGCPTWDLHPTRLWPTLHGRAYRPLPKSDLLFLVLYGMGIHPNQRPFRFRTATRFASLEEAVRELGRRYRVETRDQATVLRDYLDAALAHGEDGERVLLHSGTCVRMWWEVGEI